MKKALIVITSDIYIRNYLRTEAFSELHRIMDCDYVADSRVKNSNDLEILPGFRGYFSIPDKARYLHDFHFSLMMWRFRKRSRTFTHRWLRNSGWHAVKRVGSPWVRVLSFLSWLVGSIRNPHGLRIPLLANPLTYPLTSAIVRKRLEINSDIAKYFDLTSYDVCLFPSAAFDAATVDAIRIGKRKSVPTVCLIDNWDNLTSKTVFWKLPDFLGVWGLQAKEQAMRIHGFKAEQVTLLGTPRFEPYFKYRQMHLESHYQFPYILFVGSAMPYDELGALHELEGLIARDVHQKDSLKIIYRPHPWQQKRATNAIFDESEFSRTVLDFQMKKAYEGGVLPEKTDEKFQPSLDYYPSLLANAEVVVGPLTTMLLEAALSLRPVIGLSYYDGYHANTSLRYFSHFEGTEKIPGFNLCESRDALPGLLSDTLSIGQIDESLSTEATKYFVFNDSRDYPQRLANFVSEVSNNP